MQCRVPSPQLSDSDSPAWPGPPKSEALSLRLGVLVALIQLSDSNHYSGQGLLSPRLRDSGSESGDYPSHWFRDQSWQAVALPWHTMAKPGPYHPGQNNQDDPTQRLRLTELQQRLPGRGHWAAALPGWLSFARRTGGRFKRFKFKLAASRKLSSTVPLRRRAAPWHVSKARLLTVTCQRSAEPGLSLRMRPRAAMTANLNHSGCQFAARQPDQSWLWQAAAGTRDLELLVAACHYCHSTRLGELRLWRGRPRAGAANTNLAWEEST